MAGKSFTGGTPNRVVISNSKPTKSLVFIIQEYRLRIVLVEHVVLAYELPSSQSSLRKQKVHLSQSSACLPSEQQ